MFDAGGVTARADLDLSRFEANLATALAGLARLDAAMRSVPAARVTIDTTQADTALQAVRADLRALPTATARLDVSALEAAAKTGRTAADQLRASLQALAATKGEPVVDTTATQQNLGRVQQVFAQLRQLVQAPLPATSVTPHLDDKALRTEVAGLRGFIREAFQGFGPLTNIPGLGFLTTAPALVGAASLGAAVGALGKAAVDMGLAFETAFRQMAVSTGAAGGGLDALTASLQTVAAEGRAAIGDIADVMAQLSVRTGETGPALEGLTRQVLQFSRLTGGQASEDVKNIARLFENWHISTDQQAATLDKFVVIMQKTGEAPGPLLEALNRFQPLFAQFGLGLDQAIALLAKFEEEGVPARETIQGLRQAIDNFIAQGKTPAQGLQDTITAIQALGSESEATTVAITTFGPRAGAAIAELARSGRLNTEEFVAALQQADGALERTFQAADTPAKRVEAAFQGMLRQLQPVGESLIQLGGLVALSLTSGLKDLEGTGTRVREFSERVAAALGALQGLQAAAAQPLATPGGGAAPDVRGGQVAGLLGLQGAGITTADAVLDEFAAEVRRHAADPSLGGDAFQRFVLNVFAPDRLQAALQQTAVQGLVPGFEALARRAGDGGAEAGIAFAGGFARTDIRDAVQTLLTQAGPGIDAALATLGAAGIDGGALLLRAYEQGIAQTSPDLFGQLAALKEEIAASLAGGHNTDALETQFRGQIAALFGNIDPHIVDTMWASILGRSEALAAAGGAAAGQAHVAGIAQGIESDADKLARSAAVVLHTIDDVFRQQGQISIDFELNAPTTLPDRIALLQTFQRTLADTKAQLDGLTDADQRAALTAALNAAKQTDSAVGLAAVATAAQAAAAAQQVLGDRYGQLTSAALPGLTAAQAELVKQLELAHDPAGAASAALAFLGVGAQGAAQALQQTGGDFTRYVQGLQRIAAAADPVAAAHRLIADSAKTALSSILAGLPAADRAWGEYRAARVGDAAVLTELASHFGIDPDKLQAALAQGGQAFADLQAQMQRIVQTADPVANANKLIEASAQSMLQTLTQGLPALDRAWLDSVAARQGNRDTLRALYAAMGGDGEGFVRATEAQQQRLVQSLSQARQAAETFHSTGRLLPAPQEPDVIRQTNEQFAQITQSASRGSEDLAVAAQRHTEDLAAHQAQVVQTLGNIQQAYAERVAEGAATLARARAETATQQATLEVEFARTQQRETDDFNRQWLRQQRDFAQQDTESLRGFREQAGDLLGGLTAGLHDAAAAAAQGLLGLSGSALGAAATGVVDQFLGVSEAAQQAARQVTDAQTGMLQKIRDTFQQINRQAAETARGLRDQLLQAGALGPSGGVFGTPATTARAAALDTPALLAANLKVAETAAKQQELLTTAQQARDAIDTQATAAQQDLQKQLVDLNKQAREQRQQMIVQLTRQVEAFQRGAFQTVQGRADQREDTGLQRTRAEEDAARQFGEAVRQLQGRRQEAEQQARAQLNEAARQRAAALQQVDQQEQQARLQERRYQEDVARQERRRREDRDHQVQDLQEQLRRAERQVELGDAANRHLATIEARLRETGAAFDVHDSVFMEPASELFGLVVDRMAQRVAQATAG